MFSGVYIPIVTPFLADGSLDLKSLAKLAERLVGDGVAGLVPLGTTGESSALDSNERSLVVETCAKAVAGTSTQLIVGAGTNNTHTTLEAMRLYEQYEPDAFLIVTPYYVRPSEEGIIAHFMAVGDCAQQMNSNVMLYNIPARTGRYVSTQGVLECAKHNRITGIKQAVGSLDDESLNLLRLASDDFSILSGDDALAAPYTLLGGKGAVAASAHLNTPMWVELVQKALDGDVVHTRELHEKLLPLVNAGFSEPNPTVFKGVLASSGEIESDFVRLPLVRAKDASIENCLTISRELN